MARIFVVDDEQIIADSLTAIFIGHLHQASAFYDGESALAACEPSPPDCIISDVVMPGISGIELAEAVYERYPECRIILFSGQATTLDLLETARRRGHDFELLPKPLHPQEILARIELRSTPGSAPANQSACR